MDLLPTSDMIVRVVLAAALGAVIGFQREVDDQPAGLRTHLAVGLGAALFGVVSTLGFSEFEESRSNTNVTIDVTRVASQVVVGIGFLGAGVIFRRGADVKNLTTAATLWSTAAIGLAAGVGDGGIAVFATILLVFVLAVLRVPRDWVRRHLTRTVRVALVRVRSGVDAEWLRSVVDAIDDARFTITGVEKRDGVLVYRVRVDASPGHDPEACIESLVHRPEVDDVRFVEDVRTE